MCCGVLGWWHYCPCWIVIHNPQFTSALLRASKFLHSQNFSSFCGHVLLVKSASQLNSQQKTPGPLVAGDAYRIRRITGPIKTFTPGDFNIFLVEVCFPTYFLITKIYQTSIDISLWNPRNGKNATLILVYNKKFLWTVTHVKITTPPNV